MPFCTLNDMKRPAILTIGVCLAMLSRGEDTTKPWTFWYWMYGAVSEQGIKADLKAMKDGAAVT